MRVFFKSRQKGFTFVELSLALVIIGLSMLMLWQFVGRQVQLSADAGTRDLLVRAQKSLINFALVNGRLPCPASTASGNEDCKLTVGYFPFITAGLPETSARKLGYQLADDATSLTAPMAVKVLVPVMRDGTVTTSLDELPAAARFPDIYLPPPGGVLPNASFSTTGGRLLDLCQALINSSAGAGSLAFQLRPDTAVLSAKVATDKSETTSKGELASRLDCQRHFNPSARAHPNIRIAAAALEQSLSDFHAQKKLNNEMAASDVVGLGYSVFNAGWTASRTLPKVQNAYSKFRTTVSLDVPTLIAVTGPMAQIASDVTTVARHTTNWTRANALMLLSLDLMSNIEEIQENLARLRDQIGTRIVDSANAGLQLNQKSSAESSIP